MVKVLLELFPYVAVAVAILASVRRYLRDRFTFSSLSSQFLEGEDLFLGVVVWHYSIIALLVGHLVGFLFPERVLAFNAAPVRLYILEVGAVIFGLTALIGLISLAVRRAVRARIRAVTSPMDVVIMALLLVQVCLGVYVAVTLRWGSSWYAVAVVPYLRSLIAFQPDSSLLDLLPLAVKLHVLGAFVLLTLLPFSRLVHALVVPWQYLWLRPQQVIWNRNPKRSLPR